MRDQSNRISFKKFQQVEKIFAIENHRMRSKVVDNLVRSLRRNES